jgi:hypothetical protein
MLYVGIAAPLAEAAQVWIAELPKCATKEELQAKLKAFPKNNINAYGFQRVNESALAFRTSPAVNPDLVQQEVEQWSGKLPDVLPKIFFYPIPPLDYRRALSELRQELDRQPLQIATRIGLTIQQLQRDLSDLQPEMILLYCHGTPEGCLLFEDGRAKADFVSGPRLFTVLTPRPKVLFLAACHSGAVLDRAQESANWNDGAIVYVKSETPVEVTACAKFQSIFIEALTNGCTAGEAFDSAQKYIANDPSIGDVTAATGKIAPSKKFSINPSGRSVRLAPVAISSVETRESETPDQSLLPIRRVRRSTDRFVGRRPEMANVIEANLPLPVGVYRSGGDRRIVTLTKEGGIGKTALAAEIFDWIQERDLFPGGCRELPCEQFTTAQEFLSHLLALFGVSFEDQRGDLFELLAKALVLATEGKPALLLLDNLDDLMGKKAPQEVRDSARRAFQTMMTAAPELRILATCRWPLGLSEYETELRVSPLEAGEALQVFLSHLGSPMHRLEVEQTEKQPESAVHELLEMSGYHPQSLELLACQMKRPGMTFEKLLAEARADFLQVLEDPDATEDEKDRLRKIRMTFQLSCRHLSDEAKLLFEKLSRLPAGVWCGEPVDRFIDWEELLGVQWRSLMEKELNYFALVHYRDSVGQTGIFEMLPSMLEYARKKYIERDHKEWETKWLGFWRKHILSFATILSGKLPESNELSQESRQQISAGMQQFAKQLFQRTQPNWLAALEAALNLNSKLASEFVLSLVQYFELSGQRLLLKELLIRVVNTVRASGVEEELAPCLGTLGTVLSNLGERESAKTHYLEALQIYRRLAQAHPAAYEPDVATTLNNLGTVLSDLGEIQKARDCYAEALHIFVPLAQQWPAAFARYVFGTLRNYTIITPETSEDPWWPIWKDLQKTREENRPPQDS